MWSRDTNIWSRYLSARDFEYANDGCIGPGSSLASPLLARWCGTNSGGARGFPRVYVVVAEAAGGRTDERKRRQRGRDRERERGRDRERATERKRKKEKERKEERKKREEQKERERKRYNEREKQGRDKPRREKKGSKQNEARRKGNELCVCVCVCVCVCSSLFLIFFVYVCVVANYFFQPFEVCPSGCCNRLKIEREREREREIGKPSSQKKSFNHKFGTRFEDTREGNLFIFIRECK